MDNRCTAGKYKVEREVLDEQRLEEVTQRKAYSATQPSICERLKDSVRCTVPKLKRSVVSSLPVFYWLPKYSVWDYGMPDLISGISVGIMQIPQGMAYALLASLPPVFGLYSSLYPAIIYFFVGTSRHISIGTLTVLSIMLGSVTESLAPVGTFPFVINGTNITTELDINVRDAYRVKVAVATTVLGGLIQVLLGVVKFGFVGTYLSEPLVRAYTTAAAAHAVVAQLKNIFGVSPKRFNGPLSLVYTFVDVCRLLPNTHLPTLIVSSVTMVLLISAKELNSFFSARLPVPIPVELITIVAGTLASTYGQLNQNYTVQVVGKIPSGLSSPSLPDLKIFGEVIGDAFALAIVGYAISISLGKTFAIKHGYKVDSNQELVAVGLCNALGGFFQCFFVGSSMSRSLIQETTGGKTQVAGIVSALIVLVTLLKLGSLFQELPKAILAVIVLVNLKGMFKQYSDLTALWRSSKIDLAVWVVTWVSTLLLNTDLGLAASIVFALFTVIFRTQLPKYSILGNVPGTELYVDLEMHSESREIPGVSIFRSSAPIYFANAELYLEALKEKSGLDISKIITHKRRQEAKQRRIKKKAEGREKRQAKKERHAREKGKQLSGLQELSVEEEAVKWSDASLNEVVTEREDNGWMEKKNGTVFVIPSTPQTPHGQARWEYLKGSDPECTSKLQDGDTHTLASSSVDTLSHDLERISLGSMGKWTWDIHTIILDLSTASFIDTVGIMTIKNIFQDFNEIGVDVYISGCQASVVEQLERGNFFSAVITKRRLFASIHDAVLYCLNHRRAMSFPRFDSTVDLQNSTQF